MLLIGIGHKARQGKDAAAAALLQHAPIDRPAKIYKFADALRKEVMTAIRVMGGDAALIEGMGCPAWVKVESGKPRTILQWWGTDFRRSQDPQYWVKKLRRTLDTEQPDLAVISDVRMLNEAEFIHAAGGYLVKCVRTTPPDILVHPHPSENELDGYKGWDFQIAAATLPDLRKQAAAIYQKIVGRK